MLNRALIAGFLCGLLVAYTFGCGGGGSAGPLAPESVALAVPGPRLAFEELWEPRTPATGICGGVMPRVNVQTPDGADPQLPWAYSAICGKWGTLVGLDGTPGGPPMNVTGTGPNAWWAVEAGRLQFRAHPVPGTDGFPFISRQTFSRAGQIVIEADLRVTAAGPAGFAGLVLIAGEGDYRQIAFRFEDGLLLIKRNTPLRETLLATAQLGQAYTFRLEYDPAAGLRYLVDGVQVATEAIDHQGASFVADPSVALYFAGDPKAPGSFVEGSVGRVRVWTAPAPAAIKEAGNA